MSLAEIMTGTEALTPAEQKELAAFLTVLRMKGNGEWDGATGGVANENREGWVTLEQSKRKPAEAP